MKSAPPIVLSSTLALALLVSGGGPRSSRADAEPGRAAPAAGAAGEVSFRRELVPLLARSCASPSCHGGTSKPPVLGRLHDAAVMRAALVNVPSEDRPDRPYIAPGAPDSSYLVQKIEGHLVPSECTLGDCGDPMPLDNPPLSADDQAMVRAWVAQGARDN